MNLRFVRVLRSVALAAVFGCAVCAAGLAESKADAEFSQGKALMQKKQYAQALQHFDSALQHDNKLKTAYLLRGEANEKLKKYEDAIDSYNLYVQMVPNDPDVFLRLSDDYEKTGKNNVAISYLGKAVVMRPRDGHIYARRANLYDKLGEHNLAVIDRDVAKKLGVAAPDSGTKNAVRPAHGAKGKSAFRGTH
jgi:tetratricopeptide (TPR) repeat protein